MGIPSYAMPPHRGDRQHQAFRRLRAERPTWHLELVAHTTAGITRWQRPQPPQRRLAKRIDVRRDQAELADALRAANPLRWTDHALAELLGIDVAAVEALETSTEAICHA